MKTLLLFILLTTASVAATIQGEITKYSDADTLRIWNQPIRLLGIDAPEYAQTCKDGNGREYKCGIDALNRLKEIIGSSEVRCEGDEMDRYKRLLATCYWEQLVGGRLEKLHIETVLTQRSSQKKMMKIQRWSAKSISKNAIQMLT